MLIYEISNQKNVNIKEEKKQNSEIKNRIFKIKDLLKIKKERYFVLKKEKIILNVIIFL